MSTELAEPSKAGDSATKTRPDARPSGGRRTHEDLHEPLPTVAALVRDDELRERLLHALAASGISCERIGSIRSGQAQKLPDLLVVDAGGFADVQELRYRGRVAVLCDRPTPAQRVRFMACGAERVLDARWPADSLARVVGDSARALRSDATRPSLAHFVSTAPAMEELVATARLLVDAPSPVLFTGETGVGKEHLARAIHTEGPRARSPFLLVNCGALPETLLESQLFGHVRGAFTGADRSRQGFFEAAKDGTLLLDEIGEMPPHLQVKLLTVLERREVVPVGGCKPVPVQARIMAATNRDLAEQVEREEFRADLFYRLNVVHLDVPPLRDRPEDIADLLGGALFDLRDTAPAREPVGDIDEGALEALLRYPWPGNVRELRNVIERALVLGRERQGSKIEVEDLPAEVRAGESILTPGSGPKAAPAAKAFRMGRSLKEAREAVVAEAERAYLEAALQTTQGRIAQTARRAGIGTRSLYDKMKRYGLRKEDFRPHRQSSG